MIAELIGVVVIRKMMCCFFDAPFKVQPMEYMGYILYYIFHLMACFLKLTATTYLTGHMILLTAITFCYSSGLGTKFCTAFYTAAAVVFSDMVFLFLCGCTERGTHCVWSCFASKLTLVALMRFFTSEKRRSYSFRAIPAGYILMITGIPVASLYLLSILADSGVSAPHLIGCSLCIMAVNGITLAFYFHTAAYYKEQTQWEIFPGKSATGNTGPAAASINSLRIFRHDMVNHFSVLEYYLKEGNSEKGLDYLRKMNHLCENRVDFHTGSLVVDGILGNKVSAARQKGIHVSCDVCLSGGLFLPDFDLTCVLGNLLDNAVEAAQQAPDKEIRVSLRCSGKQLALDIRNTFEGSLCRGEDLLMTTKQDREMHGIGLQSVAQTVRKFNGSMELYQEGSYFCTAVKLYVK